MNKLDKIKILKSALSLVFIFLFNLPTLAALNINYGNLFVLPELDNKTSEKELLAQNTNTAESLEDNTEEDTKEPESHIRFQEADTATAETTTETAAGSQGSSGEVSPQASSSGVQINTSVIPTVLPTSEQSSNSTQCTYNTDCPNGQTCNNG